MMVFETLLAKSDGFGRRRQSIREHTEAVMFAGERLVEITGKTQLAALGLDPAAWFDRFRREIKVAALLHDLGKANSHFQLMISRKTNRRQGLRHEAVSYLIARQREVNEWLLPAIGDQRAIELVLWAIAGHHRKFPPVDPPEDSELAMCVYLSHPDFRETLRLGTRELSLPEPPHFNFDRTLELSSIDSSLREFDDAQDEAEDLMSALSSEERRYTAALKACLICADVAGSIEFRGRLSINEWISQAFECFPRVDQLESIVQRGLKGGEIRPFQDKVSRETNRIVFVQAGCGSGKTSAAYLWAARQAPGQRLFFCYPTTGTATEGYRDYLIDPTLDAELIHGRSDVDMQFFELGEDEPGRDIEQEKGESNRAKADSFGALEQWSTPLVSCTVDTVLGLIQNHRRGLYAWPSIAGAAFVFDEIHSYDDELFSALLRFLSDVRGVRCLLMTASLPEFRLQKLQKALLDIGESLGGPIDGPEDLQILKRYRREQSLPWDRVEEEIARGRKVLWVVNTVADAIRLSNHTSAASLSPILYHSRFRYVDRVAQHRDVIKAFAEPNAAAFAITTQVAEMSLDISADLLIIHTCPIPSLIQRLGRLNRRARPGQNDGTRPFIILEPDCYLPYTRQQLEEARAWLDSLGNGELSQADLSQHWIAQPTPPSDRRDPFVWFDGGFVTQPRPLRSSSPGIEIILPRDRDDVQTKRSRPEEVRIPMPPPPKGVNWQAWDEIAFCKVPPEDLIIYNKTKGAEWKR